MTHRPLHYPHRIGRPAGFTLIELLVVISIFALLIAVLLPVLGASREQARRAQCLAIQRQIAITAFAYTVDNKGRVIRNYARTGSEFPDGSRNQLPNRLFRDVMEGLNQYADTQLIFGCPSYGGDENPGPLVGNLYMNTRQMFMPGLADPRYTFGALWFESPRTPASLDLGIESSERVLVAEPNWHDFVFVEGTSNHGLDLTNATYDVFLGELPGSNRTYADGSGEWAPFEELGANFGRPTVSPFTAHYSSRVAGGRPYLW